LKKRLLVLLALAMMLSATVAGPASAIIPPGNNGNHYGECSPYLQDSGKHIGAGAGMGQFDNEGLYRRGLK